jgi:short-subunit dehydrogenase
LKKQEINKSRFAGKTALITGASSGIGAETARLLAQKGLKVILVARRMEKLEQLADEIIQSGGTARIIQTDLSRDEDIQGLLLQIHQGGIQPDVLINNAGFGWYGYFADMPEQTAMEMLQVNVNAVVRLTREIIPHLQTKGSGAIINVSSIAGGLPNQGIAIYAASKAFLDAFSTSLHREMKGSGVQVSVVRPGPVKTEFFQTARKLPNGGSLPAEGFSVSADKVAIAIVNLLEHPRRVVYVPGMLAISKWLEPLFGWLIDHLGPVLLRNHRPIKPLV